MSDKIIGIDLGMMNLFCVVFEDSVLCFVKNVYGEFFILLVVGVFENGEVVIGVVVWELWVIYLFWCVWCFKWYMGFEWNYILVGVEYSFIELSSLIFCLFK